MIRRLLIALPLVIAGWLATLALVMRASDDAPAAFVPFPPAGLLAALPKDVSLTGRTSVSLTLQSALPDLTAKLYAAGAWLVLPAGLESCIPSYFRQPIE